jgi:Anti-sigma factor NepR
MGTTRSDREGQQETAPASSGQPEHPAISEPGQGQTAAEPPQKASKETASTMPEPPQRQRQREKGATLDRSLQARIGSVLRESFTDIEREPLPERLEDLIRQLQAGEKVRSEPEDK